MDVLILERGAVQRQPVAHHVPTDPPAPARIEAQDRHRVPKRALRVARPLLRPAPFQALEGRRVGLGRVEDFPFVDPPDQAQVTDGRRLLLELGALRDDDGSGHDRLTRLGRRLARLPVDPRVGRMIIESDRHGCVREVLVIAAALSIQDVRERPREHRERADTLHRRFDVVGSDLLSIVALWDHLRERQAELSGNAFRRM
ncbi:MAG: hypothetical protein EBS10_07710, partial [Acidimicrobiia bacterium]|nr:hypothetical protein [Acidimicrobiia bacterium]